jgi:GNAT superfamily N-acetyltransferase
MGITGRLSSRAASGFGAVPMPESMKEDSIAHLEEPRFRLAGPADAEAVANLHADSWRRHYRGAYSDAFLDGDVVADRLAVWTDRLREPNPRRCTILAEDGSLVGFAHTVFHDDPTWGALLDNMHVGDGYKRRGIGSRLLALTAQAVTERPERTGLYLWSSNRMSTPRPSTRPAAGDVWGEVWHRRPALSPAGLPDRRRSCDTPGRNPLCCSESRERRRREL